MATVADSVQTTEDKASVTKSSESKKRNNNGRASRKKRKYQQAQSQYEGVSFSKRESTGRPGTPHRLFASSYTVQMNSDLPHDKDATEQSKIGIISCSGHNQIIHRHKNGLIIVTPGAAIQNILDEGTSITDDPDVTVTGFKFKVVISSSQSVGSKRKKARKMKSGGGGNDGFVKPNDTLAVVTFSNGLELDLKCCVAGTLFEINERLVNVDGETDGGHKYTYDVDDPLLDGYLAVIMPTGFPEI